MYTARIPGAVASVSGVSPQDAALALEAIRQRTEVAA